MISIPSIFTFIHYCVKHITVALIKVFIETQLTKQKVYLRFLAKLYMSLLLGEVVLHRLVYRLESPTRRACNVRKNGIIGVW